MKVMSWQNPIIMLSRICNNKWQALATSGRVFSLCQADRDA